MRRGDETMKKLSSILAVGLIWSGADLRAAPIRLSHAHVRTETVVGSVADTIYKSLGGSSGPVWFAWDSPLAGPRYVCCFGTSDEAERSPCSGHCDLEDEHRNSAYFDSGSGDCIDTAEAPRLLVFARFEGKELRRLRMFSQDCAIDADGQSVVWLAGVTPAASVAFLEGAVEDPGLERKKGKRSGEPALSAIALHDDPSADAALERFVGPASPDGVRRQAAFWLGNARGRRGYEVLRRLASSDSSEEFRKHVTFALSQSKEPEAIDTLIVIARNDHASEVRGQALFWLAQKAGRKAAGAIQDAIDRDPETEVKKRAVFALTLLPRDEGVPELIRVARTNRNLAVRKQAMFWLGQSRDPRALAFFEEILLK
jgi:HEAT repeat protein